MELKKYKIELKKVIEEFLFKNKNKDKIIKNIFENKKYNLFIASDIKKYKYKNYNEFKKDIYLILKFHF